MACLVTPTDGREYEPAKNLFDPRTGTRNSEASISPLAASWQRTANPHPSGQAAGSSDPISANSRLQNHLYHRVLLLFAISISISESIRSRS